MDRGSADMDRNQADLTFLEIIDGWLRERLSGELDAAFAGLGLMDGTVAERINFLAEQPGQLYEDSDLGRAALIERLAGLEVHASKVRNHV